MAQVNLLGLWIFVVFAKLFFELLLQRFSVVFTKLGADPGGFVLPFFYGVDGVDAAT